MKRPIGTTARHTKTTASQVVEVAAGLIFRRGKLLITQRHPGAHLGGLWEFPGGKRQPRETFRHCVARELREELGIEVAVDRLLQSITHAYPDKTVHLKFYFCRLERGEPQPLGCAALAWVGKDELANYQFPAADTRLLAKLRRTPRFWQKGNRQRN